MNKKDPEELIDAFLKNQLRHDERVEFERMLAEDPAFKDHVAESIEAFRFLQHAAYKRLKAKLRDYDRQQSHGIKRRGIILYALAGVAVILLMWILMIDHYDPEKIARRNFSYMHADLNITRLPDEVYNDLTEASAYFRQRDYANAARLLQPHDSLESTGDEVKWNVLMSHLAQEGATAEWAYRMDAFCQEGQSAFHKRGERLLRFLQSPGYYWLSGMSSSRLSVLRPKLI